MEGSRKTIPSSKMGAAEKAIEEESAAGSGLGEKGKGMTKGELQGKYPGKTVSAACFGFHIVEDPNSLEAWAVDADGGSAPALPRPEAGGWLACGGLVAAFEDENKAAAENKAKATAENKAAAENKAIEEEKAAAEKAVEEEKDGAATAQKALAEKAIEEEKAAAEKAVEHRFPVLLTRDQLDAWLEGHNHPGHAADPAAPVEDEKDAAEKAAKKRRL